MWQLSFQSHILQSQSWLLLLTKSAIAFFFFHLSYFSIIQLPWELSYAEDKEGQNWLVWRQIQH